ESPASVADAPAGLSCAELAIAETGSVLLTDNSLAARVVSMLTLTHFVIAERLLNNKLKNAQSTGATVIVADNPGCLMHLRGGVDAGKRYVRVLHLAQLIAERLQGA